MLLDTGCNVDKRDRLQNAPIHAAVRQSMFWLVSNFFKGNNILYLPGMGVGKVFGTGWLIEDIEFLPQALHYFLPQSLHYWSGFEPFYPPSDMYPRYGEGEGRFTSQFVISLLGFPSLNKSVSHDIGEKLLNMPINIDSPSVARGLR